jgi:hypothetical protein
MLSAHVLSLETPFASWQIGIFTYWIDLWLLTLLFSLQYLSESCFGNDNTFSLPNPWVVLFFIYPTFYSLEILFTQPFSLRCHPPQKIMTLTKKLDWLKHQSKLTSYCRHSLQTPTTFDYKRQHHGLSVLEVPCKVRLKTSGSFYTGCIKKGNGTPARERFCSKSREVL